MDWGMNRKEKRSRESNRRELHSCSRQGMGSQVGGEELRGKGVASSSPRGVSIQVGDAGEGRKHLGGWEGGGLVQRGLISFH